MVRRAVARRARPHCHGAGASEWRYNPPHKRSAFPSRMVETSSCQFADVIVAAPVGRVDHRSVGELEAALVPLVKDASGKKGVLVLDFAGVDYISSVGLRILMIAAKELRAAGAKIAVANAASRSSRRSSPSAASIASSASFRRCATRSAQLSPAALVAFDRARTARGAMKRVRFWGTRGSLPVALTASAVREKLVARRARRLGPHVRVGRRHRALRRRPRVRRRRAPTAATRSCVEIETGGPDYVICDLGSGVRPFGQAALARHGPAVAADLPRLHVPPALGSHHGVAVLRAGLHPGNRVVIYGSHPGLESALRRQQDAPSFPVDFSFLRADIEFVHLEPGPAARRSPA